MLSMARNRHEAFHTVSREKRVLRGWNEQLPRAWQQAALVGSFIEAAN